MSPAVNSICDNINNYDSNNNYYHHYYLNFLKNCERDNNDVNNFLNDCNILKSLNSIFFIFSLPCTHTHTHITPHHTTIQYNPM